MRQRDRPRANLSASLRGIIIGLALVTESTVSGDIGQAENRSSANLEEALCLDNSAGPHRTAMAISAILDKTSKDELRKYAISTLPCAAVNALWRIDDFSQQAQADHIAGFLVPRYLSEEMGLVVPLEWEANLICEKYTDARDLDRATLYYFERGSRNVVPSDALKAADVHFILKQGEGEYRISRSGIKVDAYTDLRVGLDTISIVRHGLSIQLKSAAVLRPGSPKPCCCAAALYRSKSFVAFHDDNGESYNIICLDSRSGRIVWISTVWAAFPGGAPYCPSGLPSFHDVRLTAGAGLVAAFGNVSGIQYVEAFDIRTGRAKLRFATNGWEEPGLRQGRGGKAPAGEEKTVTKSR